MSDLTPMLQEMAARADATGMLTLHEVRAVGERRRKRLVVVTATCVVLGLVGAVLLVRGVTPDAVSIDPAGQPNPTTTPSPDDRVGLVGPPPPGTPPTGPATGELVAGAPLYNSGTWVYADGRIINVAKGNRSDQFQGYVVRQLTPSGVEAMRSFLLDGTSGLTTPADPTDLGLIVRDGGRLMHVRDFDGCENEGTSRNQSTWVGCPGFTDPDWLPASAWEDPTYQPFVPHSYQVCLLLPRRSSPAEVLPTEAVDILSASSESSSDCWVLANSVARELADIIDEADPGYERLAGSPALRYQGPNGSDLIIFEPVLPNGEIYCTACG